MQTFVIAMETAIQTAGNISRFRRTTRFRGDYSSKSDASSISLTLTRVQDRPSIPLPRQGEMKTLRVFWRFCSGLRRRGVLLRIF